MASPFMMMMVVMVVVVLTDVEDEDHMHLMGSVPLFFSYLCLEKKLYLKSIYPIPKDKCICEGWIPFVLPPLT